MKSCDAVAILFRDDASDDELMEACQCLYHEDREKLMARVIANGLRVCRSNLRATVAAKAMENQSLVEMARSHSQTKETLARDAVMLRKRRSQA